jgi:hypothetical protein
MAIAVAPLTVYQGGPETTPGTAVAATRKFALESLDITATDSVYRPQITNGILLDNPGGETINSRGATWVARGPVVYNELHRWASMVVGTLVTTGGASPYTHTFTKLATANPTLKSWTLERRISDGSTHLPCSRVIDAHCRSDSGHGWHPTRRHEQGLHRPRLRLARFDSDFRSGVAVGCHVPFGERRHQHDGWTDNPRHGHSRRQRS